MAEKKKTKKLRLIDIDPNYAQTFIDFFADGLSLQMIANAFGISLQELYKNLREDTDLMAAMHKQRNINVCNVAKNLYQKAISDEPRNNNCTFYYLDKVGKFSSNWADDDGIEKPIPESHLKITTTDPVEAMREYERIMRAEEKKDNS